MPIKLCIAWPVKIKVSYLLCCRSCVSHDYLVQANQAVYHRSGAVYGSDGGGVSSITIITLTLDLIKTINGTRREDGHSTLHHHQHNTCASLMMRWFSDTVLIPLYGCGPFPQLCGSYLSLFQNWMICNVVGQTSASSGRQITEWQPGTRGE